MPVIFRLYQEGEIRTNGFQTTEWFDSNPLYTTPAYRQPLVLHKNGYGLPDAFERVAVPIDFGALQVNPLTAFDAKGPFTVGPASPLPGDTLRIFVNPLPHWSTTTPINGISYTPAGDGYMDFPFVSIDAFRTRHFGDSPPAVHGNILLIPNYQFTSEDVGRVVSLSGFTNSINNATVIVRATNGGAAITNFTFIDESGTPGSSWTISRLIIDASKPFPRIEANVTWHVKQAITGTVIMASTFGSPMRLLPDLDDFRDDRLTMISATQDIAANHFNLVQTYTRSLQRQLAEVGAAFGSVGPYDYGP